MLATYEKLNLLSAWRGKEVMQKDDTFYHFTKESVAEVDAALRHVTSLQLPLRSITKRDFPLTNLANDLAKLEHDIKFGKGFAILKDFPVRNYSLDEAGIIFWGICLYIGKAVPQSQQGDWMYYVKDLHKSDSRRYSETNSRLPFHTDGSDIISLFCYSAASQGGLSKFVSSISIYNQMAEEAPELLELLCEPLHKSYASNEVVCKDFSEYERISPFALPIFSFNESGHPVNRYAAGYITSALNRKLVPPITEQQERALMKLNEIANRPDFHVGLELEPGDMEFFNNNFVFHARSEYADGVNFKQQRCIIRIWLDSPEIKTIPPLFGYG